MRSSRRSETSLRSRNFIALSFLLVLASGCALLSPKPSPVADVCPPPQWADDKVAEELDAVPFVGFEDFWSWFSQVERLNEALEKCRD